MVATRRMAAALSAGETPNRKETARKRKVEPKAQLKKQKPDLKNDISNEAAKAKVQSHQQKSVVRKTTASSKLTNDGRLLFSLKDADELISAKILARPSKRNRSPYVADIWLEGEQREAIAHVPNLDMGGKCVPGKSVLVRPARDNKGNKVPPDAVSAKHGTPKCEFITQLLYVDESDLSPKMYPPTWVGAHPSLGERIAEQWLEENLVEGIPPVTSIEKQVRNPAGADMRSDFLLHHVDGSKRLVEVKTVVDSDYCASAAPDVMKCRFLSAKDPYTRTGIFPWGKSNQKGPEGEKVVSARAIKHVRELTHIVQGKLSDGETSYQATVLFVVIRGDVHGFRPNHEACPSFCKYLKEAEDAGVQVLAKRVRWGSGEEEGRCYDDAMLPIEWPDME